MIQALSKLSDAEKQKERDLRQQLRQRERLNIDEFFSSPKAARKSSNAAEKELMLYLKVRPRKLKPIAGSVQPSLCSSPTNELDTKSVLQTLQSPKPRKYQGKHRIYSDWEIHTSTQLKTHSRNFRSQAIQNMKNIEFSHSPEFLSRGQYEMWVQGHLLRKK